MRHLLLGLLSVAVISLSAQNDKRSCATTELHEQQMQDPAYRKFYEDRRERVRAYITKNTDGSGKMNCGSTLTLPVAVHFQGVSNPDLDCLRDLAESQLQILNEDFQGTNPDIGNWTNGAAANFPGLANGESCVAFCLARYGHPAGYGLAEGELAVTVNVTNGSSSADWAGYLNIFVRNIGALGFSPRPGRGDGDGVTVDNNAFGAGAGCAGVSPSAPYDGGRTLTHEVGHYFSLDHIWGGGCSNDDGIADTPDQSTSNGGCPGASASSCGSLDLHMNYMDYTQDDCMYMFSAGQVTAMDALVTTGLQSILDNTNACQPPVPLVNFRSSGTSLVEGTVDCVENDETAVPVTLTIATIPSAVTTVGLTASGSASAGTDYRLSNSTVTFGPGRPLAQTITLFVRADADVENDENLQLSMSVAANGGDAQAGPNGSFIVTILNDDVDPIAGSGTVLSQDFNTGLGDWTAINGGSTADTWGVRTANDNLDGTPFAFMNSDAAGNGSSTNEILLSPVFNGLAYGTLSLEWDQYIRTYTGNNFTETFTVQLFNGSQWVTVYQRNGNQGNQGNWASPDSPSVDLTAHRAANNQLRFVYVANYDWWWALDNVVVTGAGFPGVQETVNVTDGAASFDFGPNATVYFRDQITGRLMMALANNTGIDYGCTTVAVDRAANGSPWGQLSGDPGVAEVLADKTFHLSTDNITSAGSVDVTLYYTAAERAGLLAFAGGSASDLQMIRGTAPVGTATLLEGVPVVFTNVDGNWAATATLGGELSGFTLGGPAQKLPVTFLAFTATAHAKHVALNWSTAGEADNAGFMVERRTATTPFTDLGWVDGAGTTSARQTYTYDDRTADPGTDYLYRLRQTDADGSVAYSPVVTARLTDTGGTQLAVSPNPVRNVLTIAVIADREGTVQLLNARGQVLAGRSVAAGSESVRMDLSDRPAGVYLVVHTSAGQRTVRRVVRR